MGRIRAAQTHRGRTMNERISYFDGAIQTYIFYFFHLIIFIIFECFSLSEHSRECRLDRLYCNKLFHAILNFVLFSVCAQLWIEGRTTDKHQRKTLWKIELIFVFVSLKMSIARRRPHSAKYRRYLIDLFGILQSSQNIFFPLLERTKSL